MHSYGFLWVPLDSFRFPLSDPSRARKVSRRGPERRLGSCLFVSALPAAGPCAGFAAPPRETSGRRESGGGWRKRIGAGPDWFKAKAPGGPGSRYQRLRETIATNVIRCKGFHGSVTLSLGVASAGRWMQTFDHLLKAADQAAYAAKGAGRNCVFIAPEGGTAVPASA